MMGEHGLWWKCTYYEGSSRVPFIVSWPKRFEPGRRTSIASLVDVTRTVIDLAGCDVDDTDLDGRVLTGLLDSTEQDEGGVAFSEYHAHGTDRPSGMVRKGDFKLTYYYNEPPELFNVVKDHGEFTNLAEDPSYAAIRDELVALVLEKWDPARIDQTARESQRLRRIVVEGSPHLSFGHWEPGDDNWVLASAVAAVTD
jgi:choline-sulfatase